MDSSPEGPLEDDPATQYVANITAAEELQNLGIDTSQWDLFQDIPPVEPDVPRIGDPTPRQVAPPARQPITTGIGTSTRQRASTPPPNLVQQAMREADIDTSTPINTGPGTRTTTCWQFDPSPQPVSKRNKKRKVDSKGESQKTDI